MDEETGKVKGAFMESLVRTNKEIRTDRAMAIAENAELLFKREVEDLAIQIKRKKRDRENLLDQSPTNAQSLVVASDFDGKKFVDNYVRLGIEIRELEIRYEIASKSYKRLFTEETVEE